MFCTAIFIDIYKGIFIDLYKDFFIDIYKGIFIDLYKGIFIDLYKDFFIDIYKGIFIDLYKDFFIDLYKDFFIDIHKGILGGALGLGVLIGRSKESSVIDNYLNKLSNNKSIIDNSKIVKGHQRPVPFGERWGLDTSKYFLGNH